MFTDIVMEYGGAIRRCHDRFAQGAIDLARVNVERRDEFNVTWRVTAKVRKADPDGFVAHLLAIRHALYERACTVPDPGNSDPDRGL